MGDRIVVMKDGFIQQVDTPQNLYDLPVNEFVAGFMGSPQMNFVDATLVKDGADYALTFGSTKIKIPAKKANAEIANYVGKEVVFGIRPEDVHDEPDFLAKATDTKATADVEVTELMGAETYLYLNCEGNALTARVEPTSVASGDKITIAFDMNKMHLFDKRKRRRRSSIRDHSAIIHKAAFPAKDAALIFPAQRAVQDDAQPGYREEKRIVLRRGRPGRNARAGAELGSGWEATQHRAPHGLLQRGEMGAALQFERRLAGLEANKAIVSFE